MTAFEEKGNISACCEVVGISRNTFYVWCKDDEDFNESFNEIRESIIDHVEGKLMMLIEAGETAATLFFLKTIGKNRGYVERQELKTDNTDKIIVEWQ